MHIQKTLNNLIIIIKSFTSIKTSSSSLLKDIIFILKKISPKPQSMNCSNDAYSNIRFNEQTSRQFGHSQDVEYDLLSMHDVEYIRLWNITYCSHRHISLSVSSNQPFKPRLVVIRMLIIQNVEMQNTYVLRAIKSRVVNAI